MKHRWILLIAVLLTATAGLIGAAPTPAQAVIDRCVIDPASCIAVDEPAPVQQPGVARFTWSMQDRYAAGWDAWSTTYDRYSQSYVNPTGGFVVNLDACTSKGIDGIRSYVWTITGPYPAPTPTRVSGSTCRFTTRLPEATYNVTLTVTGNAGDRYTTTQSVKVNDLLIISLGDSNASGEGNPDLNTGWEDTQCHRSRTSGPAKAAQTFEAAAHRSVTFLSLACSGAEIDEGLLESYAGMEPEGQQPLAPQVTVAKQMLCRSTTVSTCTAASARHVDAILVSIGINDVGFSDTLMRCMLPDTKYWGTCDRSDAGINTAWTAIHELPGKYEELAAALATGPTAGADVYLTEYPDNPFNDSAGCYTMAGISDLESEWLHTQGRQLNAGVANAANRPHWMYVTGVAAEFQPHGYCASTPWFRATAESLIAQGDIYGTMHPTASGHAATARHIVDAVKHGPPDRTATHRATITFQQVKLADTEAAPGYLVPNPVNLWTFSTINSGRVGGEYGRTSYPAGNGIPLDQWLTVPATNAFTLDISTGDELWVKGAVTFPDTTVAATALTGGTSGGTTTQPEPRFPNFAKRYTATNGYGAGSHEVTASYLGASLSVRYSISVQPIIKPVQDPITGIDGVAQVSAG